MSGGFNIYKQVGKISVFFALFFLVVPNPIHSESTAQIIEKVDTLSEQRLTLQVEVDTFAAQLKFLEEQVAKTNLKIEENNKLIIENQEKLEIEQKKLSENLRAIYEEGQVSLLENIVKANTFSDFVDKNEYLNFTRASIKSTADNISAIKFKLTKAKKELGEAVVQNQLAKATIEKQKAEKETTLAKVTEEEMKIREKFALRLTKLGTGSPYCKTDGVSIKSKYSLFTFPTDCGYISQGFGNTEFASIDRAYNGAIHNGFDIGVNTGTPIKSIGKGTVYAKGTSPSGGWGNWVMVKMDKVKVDNKDIDFYALYAHMVLETHLKVGERVDNGTITGFVGGTPDWAPHLHFSLFISSSNWSDGTTGPYPGNVVDPLDYMDIPISTVGTDWDPRYAH